MSQLIEQLLTCAVCLERYRRPLLLPCQHTFCAEPCLQGLVDATGRSVRCPECRATHALPRAGVHGFPSNRTITGFLDVPLMQRPQQDQQQPVMARSSSVERGDREVDVRAADDPASRACKCCGEVKGSVGLSLCYHCDWYLCGLCRLSHSHQIRQEMHKDVLRLRGSGQVLSDAVGTLEERSSDVRREGETARSDVSAAVQTCLGRLRDREKALLNSVEALVSSEVHSLQQKKRNLESKLAAMLSYCDVAEGKLDGTSGAPLAEEELFKLHKQLRELSTLVQHQGCSVPTQAITCSLQNVTQLLSNIDSFGHVTVGGQAEGHHSDSTGSLMSDLDAFLPTLVVSSGSQNSLNPVVRRLNSLPPVRATRRGPLNQRTDSRGVHNHNGVDVERHDSTRQVSCVQEDGSSLWPSGRRLLQHYQQKGRPRLRFGCKGTEEGRFTWPRGLAVTPEGHLIVADSSNHRLQVFDWSGRFIRAIGSHGSGDGQFDCLSGVTVNAQLGLILVADRYNHRVQIFDRTGRFLRAFGREGAGRGQLSYPWGVACDSSGLVYVCDKDNHRVQVFSPDGVFVRGFGGPGSGEGRLDHPHYLAVTPQGRVAVSDCGNHRVQIFDRYGRYISKLGDSSGSGSGPGQMRYPRGVAVDRSGNIVVADSGNNRVKVFRPDGTFLHAFGSWGSEDGQMKGLEGLALHAGDIVVCDRENHRIQIF
ncbi:tripartite motif-containing protein 3-like isoform X1 [Petromyzon marinus]|uniref:tripartite motif-containing protein 3-like isoform X1 n=1 Tax=Petromyzon marinus TaxID=7757 RepID=UPI003F709842